MSPHHRVYYDPDTGIVYIESDEEHSVVGQQAYPGRSWSVPPMSVDQSSPSPSHPPVDDVGNQLAEYEAQDANPPFNTPPPTHVTPNAPLQDSAIGVDTTFTNPNNPSQPFAHFPYSQYGGIIDYRPPQHQHDYAPYDQAHGYPHYPPVHDAHQMDSTSAAPFAGISPQNTYVPQASQVPSTSVAYYPSTQLSIVRHDVPVSQHNSTSARPTPDRLIVDAVATGRGEFPNADTGQYSHPSPVATSSSNQTPDPGPSHWDPSSPDRKRLLPSSADDDRATGRRVLPRHSQAESVHSMSPVSPGRSRSNSYPYGRGPVIPQERYTTSSILSYNTPDQHPAITFDLENPHQVGIPIVDVLNKTDSFYRLRDRTQAFNHMGKKTFTLRVQWPGYKAWSKTIAAMDWTKTRAPITRVKLAEAVATAVRDLLEKYRHEPYDRAYAEWNVGPNGVRLDQLCLVAVHRVSRGSWQPQLCLLEPPR